jgi:hypothetical protein
MADTTELIDNYFAMWNERTADRRRTLIAAVWAPDARYVDPLTTAEGPAAIETMVTAVRQRLGEVDFRRTGPLDTHTGVLRYSWEMIGADGAVLRTGASFGRLSGDGRLAELVGFFDPS